MENSENLSNMLARSIFCFLFLFEITNARSSLQQQHHSIEYQTAPPYRVKQCREGCLEKFYTKEIACIQQAECSMCWDQCTQNTKINTNLNAWPLRTVSMVRNESLVTADVAWQLLNTPCQYLVTWEISGGGLKGNLITETPSVQLSLWPETVYRVQVTCRNKETEVVTHSLPLTLDTSHAVILNVHKYSPNTVAINTKDKDVESMSVDSNNDVELQQAEEGLRRQQQIQRPYPHHYTFKSKSLGVWTIYDNRQEIVLGVFIAILVFIVVLSIVYVVKRRKSRVLNDKQGLIENESLSSSAESNQSTPVHTPQILHF